MAVHRLPVFRWHPHNHFTLLRNGDQFFPAMLAAIASARHSIFLEIYLFETGGIAARFIDALAAAAARDVDVRVMIDAFGSLALGSADRTRLSRAGVELHVFNPLQVIGDRLRNLTRDHRKLLVVDEEVAFVGGAGITDDFSPEARPHNYWRETMLEIRGAVVHDWSRLFAHAWTAAGNPPLRLRNPSPDPSMTLPQRGRVSIAHGPAVQDVKHNAGARIQRARHRVWLATPYFLPSLTLRRQLAAASRRGVDVRLLLPGAQTDHPLLWLMSHHYYARLLRQGIRIHEFQPRFIHSKTLLVDDWVSLGSCNFDRWNLRWNLEANQEVEDAGFADDVAAMFEEDLAQSSTIDLASWEQRWPLLRRVESSLEDAGRAVERWLERR